MPNSSSLPTKVVRRGGRLWAGMARNKARAFSASSRRFAAPVLTSSDDTWLSTVRTET